MTMQRSQEGRGLVPPFGDLYGYQHNDYWPAIKKILIGGEGWIPVIDIYEKDDTYVVKAEIPGIREEDMDVSVLGGRLTLKGEKRTESEVKDEHYYRSERSYGMFSRSIDLPPNVNTNEAKACYKDGILEIVIPKTSEVKAKKINVSHKKNE